MAKKASVFFKKNFHYRYPKIYTDRKLLLNVTIYNIKFLIYKSIVRVHLFFFTFSLFHLSPMSDKVVPTIKNPIPSDRFVNYRKRIEELLKSNTLYNMIIYLNDLRIKICRGARLV